MAWRHDASEPSYPVAIVPSVPLDWYIREGDRARWPLPVVLFDGDDPLWAINDHARSRAAEIVSKGGLDPEEVEELQRKRDVVNVGRNGLSRTRFSDVK
jgi:hypothetical protein